MSEQRLSVLGGKGGRGVSIHDEKASETTQRVTATNIWLTWTKGMKVHYPDSYTRSWGQSLKGAIRKSLVANPSDVPPLKLVAALIEDWIEVIRYHDNNNMEWKASPSKPEGKWVMSNMELLVNWYRERQVEPRKEIQESPDFRFNKSIPEPAKRFKPLVKKASFEDLMSEDED